MAGSRAVSAREPGQIREEAALSGPAHAPRTRLAGAEDRRARPKARFQARVGSFRSTNLKLPQSLTSRSVQTQGGQIEVRGRVKRSLLGRRNPVVVKKLVCGRYRTVGSARPNRKGNYVVRFNAPALGTAAFYRAEARVLNKARGRGKHYVKQYARAISITVTGQTG